MELDKKKLTRHPKTPSWYYIHSIDDVMDITALLLMLGCRRITYTGSECVEAPNEGDNILYKRTTPVTHGVMPRDDVEVWQINIHSYYKLISSVCKK